MAAIGDERHPVILPGDFSEEAGAEAARMLVEGKMPADAVFAANALMAVGCLMRLGEAGLKVPHDLMVAGFDAIPPPRHLTPAPTPVEGQIDRPRPTRSNTTRGSSAT